jgi:hypothetical protein
MHALSHLLWIVLIAAHVSACTPQVDVGVSPRKPNLEGILEPDKCDSLLFTALAASHNNTGADISQFRAMPGRWFRTVEWSCLDEGRSRSDISRDMFLGLFWYIHKHGRVDWAKEIWEYGKEHSWKMGRDNGTPEGIVASYLPPTMVQTLHMLLEKFGLFQPSTVIDLIPALGTSKEEGYTRHLHMVHCALRRELGKGDGGCKEAAALYLAQDPKHPLFHRVAQLYRVEGEIPQPPRPQDRCHPWPIQDPTGHEHWTPCGVTLTYDYGFLDGLEP